MDPPKEPVPIKQIIKDAMIVFGKESVKAINKTIQLSIKLKKKTKQKIQQWIKEYKQYLEEQQYLQELLELAQEEINNFKTKEQLRVEEEIRRRQAELAKAEDTDSSYVTSDEEELARLRSVPQIIGDE